MTIRVISRIAKQGFSASIGSTVALLLASPTFAGVGMDTSALFEAVTVDGVHSHLEVFQRITDDNNGNREASSEGFFDSVDYVARAVTLAGSGVGIPVIGISYELGAALVETETSVRVKIPVCVTAFALPGGGRRGRSARLRTLR